MLSGVDLVIGPITTEITLKFCVQDAGCGAMQWDTSHSRHQSVLVHRVEMLATTWDSGTFDVFQYPLSQLTHGMLLHLATRGTV